MKTNKLTEQEKALLISAIRNADVFGLSCTKLAKEQLLDHGYTWTGAHDEVCMNYMWVTTTTITRGSEWSEENLKSSWGEIDSAYDYKAVERKLSDMVTKRFAELTPDSISWIPYTSEVIGDVTEDYSDIDLDALRQQAQDEIYQQWTNGDIDIDDCLINDRKSANAYQIQFKDYDVWIDFLDTQDGHDGLYKTDDEASDKISDLKERFPGTEFCYEER